MLLSVGFRVTAVIISRSAAPSTTTPPSTMTPLEVMILSANPVNGKSVSSATREPEALAVLPEEPLTMLLSVGFKVTAVIISRSAKPLTKTSLSSMTPLEVMILSDRPKIEDD